MFRSFVEDEKLHAKRLRLLLSNQKELVQSKEKTDTNPKKRMNTIFREMGEELKKKVNINTNDIEAVKLAIEVEGKGIQFYEQAARDATNGMDRDTFLFLATEERTHYSILKNTLEFLEKAELQEAGNEGRIYDVWMNMVNKII
jgi:rubrerythrin